jgi:hypothetical protein
MNLFHDYRDQSSWGRVCACVALGVAVIGEFRGMDVVHLKVWLSVATGNYLVSKIAEMVGNKATAEPAGGPDA